MKLPGWETSNRIQFSVPKERVSVDTEIVPILFRLSSTTGFSKTDLTFVFDYMSVSGSSYANRKKVAFSQLINGEEVQLHAELDMWDHVTEKALFWVKPKEISSTYENIFYFYYDKTKDVNIRYISEAGDLSIYPFINTGADATYDIYGGKPIALIKIDDKYLFWYVGTVVYDGYWHGVIYYCESMDLISFTNFTMCINNIPAATSIYKQPGTIIYQDGIFKMWYSGNQSNSSVGMVIYYCTSLDGKIWENFTACTGLYLSGLYGTSGNQKAPSVIYEGNKYKLWFTGWGSANTYYSAIYYAESLDGINWTNLQRSFGEESIPITVSKTELARVVKINDMYHLFISGVPTGGGNRLFYANSSDGKLFSNFDTFSEMGLEGTYDLTNISGMVVFEEIPDIYTLLYSGLLSSFYCILRVDSAFINHPMSPSQFIWDDKFSSVHHFNPSFGYVNSVGLNTPVSLLSNISSTSDNLGSYAIKFNSINSYVNLGNHASYNYGNTSQVLLFGTIDYGNVIYSKGLYSECTSTLYYQQTPLLTRSSFNDTFSGTVGSVPDPYLWSVRYGAPTQNEGSLKFSQALDERVRTTFYVGGAGTTVQFDFNIEGGSLTSGWRLALRVGFEGDPTTDYLLHLVRPSTYTNIYLYGVHRDTYTNKYYYSSESPVDYFTGKFRMTIDTTITFSYFYLGSWIRLSVLSLDNVVSGPYAFIEINKTQPTSSDLTKFYVSNFTSTFNNSFFTRNSTATNSLVLEYRKDNVTNFLNTSNFSLNSAWSSYTFGVAAELPLLNTNVGEFNTDILYCTSSGVQTTTQPVLLGNNSSGIVGKISEAFFFKKQPSMGTLYLFDANLKDNLINISRNFLRGYTTKYNQVFSTTVLIYDQDSGDLLASTISSSIDGFYYAEVPFKENYFIVGLGDTLYNNFVLSDITPQIIF